MHGLEKDTIGGFNSMIEFEKKYGWQFLFLGTNMNAIDVALKSVRTCGVVDRLWKLKWKSVSKNHYVWFFSVRQAVVLIVDNQSPIINCFILETIKYKILVTLYKSH